MSEGARIRSQSGEAYRILREAILSGAAAPGTRLGPAELSARLGIGATPIREALSRLSAENLAIAFEQRGFRVAPLSAGELRELLDLRLSFEHEAMQRSMHAGDAHWEARIIAAFHMLNRCEVPHAGQSAQGFEVWSQRHDAFHHALLSGCDMPWLKRFHGVTMEQIERYRIAILKAQYRLPAGNDSTELGALLSHDEHARLRDAVLARDEERAGTMLTTHIGRTASLFSAQFEALDIAAPP